MRRLILIALLMVCIAPGTWVRTSPKPANFTQELSLTALDVDTQIDGEAELDKIWQLRSAHADFGSYSALLLIGGNEFLAASDRGKILRFAVPGSAEPRAAELGSLTKRDPLKKQFIDLESLARDPKTGVIWLGFEGTNTIERTDSNLVSQGKVKPAAMQSWASNSGPESMVRLADGRFVVIAEGLADWGDNAHRALLFTSDPVGGTTPQSFEFQPPAGYKPVDMTELPDGRVLIVVRNWRLGIPPLFVVKLVVADPQDIRPGEVWSGREIAAITDPAIADNFEGIAAARNPDGSIAIWLISDDNNASFQRSLLLKLRWQPGVPSNAADAKEKAPGNPARPSR